MADETDKYGADNVLLFPTGNSNNSKPEEFLVDRPYQYVPGELTVDEQVAAMLNMMHSLYDLVRSGAYTGVGVVLAGSEDGKTTGRWKWLCREGLSQMRLAGEVVGLFADLQTAAVRAARSKTEGDKIS